jgi:hypothetical protein
MERSDDLETRETDAAAAAARRIGGEIPDDGLDPAERPLVEAGEGEAEGFELAERDLIRNASHDDGQALPLEDAFTPETESDEAGAEYGEADEEEPPDA